VLAARIDRLAPDEKALLQQLAVIGREFPLSLVRQVIFHPEEELYHLLSSLQHKEFLYEQPAFPEGAYIFKHALTQEVAYNSLLIERRRTLHEQTARAIEALYNAGLEDHYSELAHHYSCGGNTEKAVQYLYLAGRQAVQRSANKEAIELLTNALELLQTVPDSAQRDQQELLLQTTLGSALLTTKGYGAPEVGRVYTRARELCQQVGETPQLFPILWALGAFYMSRLENETARTVAEQFLELAERLEDPTFLLWAHYTIGWTFYCPGQLSQAREHYEQAIALYDPNQHRATALVYGQDPGVASRCMAAWTLWLLGYPDQAYKRTQEALTLAQEGDHPYSVVFALESSAWDAYNRGEVQALRERSDATIASGSEYGFAFQVAWGTIMQGTALVEQGDGEKGLAQIRRGLTDMREGGTRIAWTRWLAFLVEACWKEGCTEEGFKVLAEALEIGADTGEAFFEADLYRLKGELMLQQFQVSGFTFQVENSSESRVRSPEAEAEECFWKAIEIARKQQAKSLELRAMMSLSRLWRQQGKTTEAHRMLSEIYNWFTEGFDTKDLQEAKTLLEELTH
jgi:predicted ATPase